MEEYESIPEDELYSVILNNFTTTELLQLIKTTKSAKILNVCRSLLGKNPTNEELLLAIAADPDNIDDYAEMWDEKDFPFIVELFRSRVVSYATIRAYLGNSNYNFEDLIYSMYQYMSLDPQLPVHLEIILDVFGRDNLPPEQLEVLLSKNAISSNMLIWLQSQQKAIANYAPKPDHVVLLPADNFTTANIPVLAIQVPTSVEDVKTQLGNQLFDAVLSTPSWIQSRVISAMSVNGQEVLNSQILDWWFGPICPDIISHILVADDIDDPVYKYGGRRMLLDTLYEYDEYLDEYKSEWFTGNCQQCSLKIAYPHYAIRKPRFKGGWSGCYCSWECLKDEMETLLQQLDEIDGGITAEQEAGKEQIMMADEAEFQRVLDEYNSEVQLIAYFKGKLTIADRDANGQAGPSINPSSITASSDDQLQPTINTSALLSLFSKTKITPETTINNVPSHQQPDTKSDVKSDTDADVDASKTTITESSGQWPFLSFNSDIVTYEQSSLPQ